MEITRRSFGLATAGAALLPVLPAAAKEAPAGTQVPGIYRMKVGSYEVTILNDGTAALPTNTILGDPMERRNCWKTPLRQRRRWLPLASMHG